MFKNEPPLFFLRFSHGLSAPVLFKRQRKDRDIAIRDLILSYILDKNVQKFLTRVLLS